MKATGHQRSTEGSGRGAGRGGAGPGEGVRGELLILECECVAVTPRHGDNSSVDSLQSQCPRHQQAPPALLHSGNSGHPAVFNV